jgi:hypothetical protein
MAETPVVSGPGVFGPGNTFQKRSVSSPAPVTMVCPSGDMARYSTLKKGMCVCVYVCVCVCVYVCVCMCHVSVHFSLQHACRHHSA